MSRKCEICGKGAATGNSVPRKGLPRKKGGGGQHIGLKSRKVFKPNLVKVKAEIEGHRKTIKVCTRCLKAGKVQKV